MGGRTYRMRIRSFLSNAGNTTVTTRMVVMEVETQRLTYQLSL